MEVFALPWSWFAPWAQPTLEQIAHSRIALHGPGDYSWDALASWWPFLFFAVLFYGMLPRFGLLLFSLWREKRALARLSFDRPDCNRLLRRMEPVVIDGEAGPGPAIGDEEPPRAHTVGGRCLAIVSRDLEIDDATLGLALKRFGWNVARRIDAEIDNADGSGELFATVSVFDGEGAPPRLAVVAADLQDPIKAVLKFLAGLRGAAGPVAEIIVFLTESGIVNPEERLTLWRRVLNGLGDPGLSAERAAGSTKTVS